MEQQQKKDNFIDSMIQYFSPEELSSLLKIKQYRELNPSRVDYLKEMVQFYFPDNSAQAAKALKTSKKNINNAVRSFIEFKDQGLLNPKNPQEIYLFLENNKEKLKEALQLKIEGNQNSLRNILDNNTSLKTLEKIENKSNKSKFGDILKMILQRNISEDNIQEIINEDFKTRVNVEDNNTFFISKGYYHILYRIQNGQPSKYDYLTEYRHRESVDAKRKRYYRYKNVIISGYVSLSVSKLLESKPHFFPRMFLSSQLNHEMSFSRKKITTPNGHFHLKPMGSKFFWAKSYQRSNNKINWHL